MHKPHICIQETAQVKWMRVEEYANTDFIKAQPSNKTSVDCMAAYQRGIYQGLTAEEMTGTRGGLHLLAHGLHATDPLPEGWENC